MKSIREFIASKIRRSEVEDRLSLDCSDTGDDEELGAFEGTLTSPTGNATFYAKGMRLVDGARFVYTDIERVELSEGADNKRNVDILLIDGAKRRILTSDAGGIVLHATLRWIGNTRLRRKARD